jgi:hypothetical protein
MPTDSESTADSKRHDEAVARFRGYLAVAAETEVCVLATDESPRAAITNSGSSQLAAVAGAGQTQRQR